MLNAITSSLTTLVVAAGALLNTNLSPKFTNVQVEYSQQNIVCSTQLENCFDQHLEKIFNSGQKVRISFLISIHRSNSNEKITEIEINNEIQFDLIDEVYEVYESGNNEGELYETIQQAKNKIASLNRINIPNSQALEQDEKFYIRISATIIPIFLDTIQKNYNLMKYWNNKSPSCRTKDLKLKNKRI